VPPLNISNKRSPGARTNLSAECRLERLARIAAVALFVATAGLTDPRAKATPPQAPVRREDLDATIVQRLTSAGPGKSRPQASVWFEPGAMSADEEELWATRISDGIDQARQVLRLSSSSMTGSSRLEYFVAVTSNGRSHYSPGPPPRVFLSMQQIKSGHPPYVHEAVHHLMFELATQRGTAPVHIWMLEGFPTYVDDVVHGHVAAGGATSDLDDSVGRALQTAEGRALATFVGSRGGPADIENDIERSKMFYMLAESFIGDLTATLGMRTMARAVVPCFLDSDRFESTIERWARKPLGDIRAEWLARHRP
jgi:hypothetical protein